MARVSRPAFWAVAGISLLVVGGCNDTVTPANPGEITDHSPTGDQSLAGKSGAAVSGGAEAGKAAGAAAQGGDQAQAGHGSELPADAGLGIQIPQDEPLTDKTEFVSADPQNGSNGASRGVAQNDSAEAGPTTSAPAPTAPVDAAASGNGAVAERTVERGDIYRVLDDKRILNLNSYRGVQILDISDLAKPRVEGRLPIAGTPVELYVLGNRAIVLLNNWQGYYGARNDVKLESVSGGLVITVDISDRAHPKLIEQQMVPGTISTSRLTQGGDRAALYIAASLWGTTSKTVVKSFDVSAGGLLPKSELDLGGYVQDIQANNELLMVSANSETEKESGRSRISLVDISSPDGVMVRGGEILAQGFVRSKFNMDVHKGVLRVVSSAGFGSAAGTNHLETFALADLQKPTPIADCTLGRRDPTTGQSEQLYATLFVENRAFFVTYYRTDPFHAFSIDDAGRCQEHNEFIVSGWNDFLTATMDNTRLIGIGHNDQNNTRNLAVSLYDASDVTIRTPLKARAEIDLNGAYSEATWDDRGFSVLEDAVSARASDGTTETGLVLLPYQGWDQAAQASIAQIQIFTFSDHTLTKRGTMDHGTAVRRSFQPGAQTTANLSEEELSLFNTQNPDAPAELGRVDIAPNYSRVFDFGAYLARVRDRSSYNYYYAPAQTTGQSREPEHNTVEVLREASDPDGADVIASIDVPSTGQLTQVGNLLVSVFTQATYPNPNDKEPTYTTHVEVFDFADPTKPVARGRIDTDRIVPSYGGWGGPYPIAIDVARPSCFDCGGSYPYQGNAQSFVVGDAIAFLHSASQQKSLGNVTQCYSYPASVPCSVDVFGNSTCATNEYYSGGITCTTPEGGEESCTGQFYHCTADKCEPVAEPANTSRNCSTFEQIRYWSSYTFDTLDLRNPDSLSIAPPLALPKDEEGTSVIAVGHTLYVNHQKPFDQPNDARAFVKHYVRLLDFADPTAPVRGDAINIPGDVIAAEGNTLFTRDVVWQDLTNTGRTLISRLTVNGKVAHQQASTLFEDRDVSSVYLDGAGHVLVNTNEAYNIGLLVPPPPIASAGVSTAGVSAVPPGSPVSPTEPRGRLDILDAVTLDTLGDAVVDNWATFKDAKRGRALFQVSGGLLLFDVRDATQPKAQAYFPTSGWPQELLFDGDSIVFAANMYGVYRFDASIFNLLTKM